MPKFKELFSTPKKAVVTLGCVGILLVTLGACIMVYAMGGPASRLEQDMAIGGEEAQRFAFADAGVDPVEVRAASAKYSRWEGQFVYEVEFIAGDTEYEYKIGASDGSVVRRETKTVKGPGESAGLPASHISLEEARDAALADAGLEREAVTFTQAELAEEDGAPVYEFEFYAGNVEYKYEINAKTGTVSSKGTTTYVGQESGGIVPSVPPAVSVPPAAESNAPPVQTQPQPPATAAPRPSGPVAPPTAGIAPPTAGITSPVSPAGSLGGQGGITLEEAKRAALTDAGVEERQVAFYKEAKLDYDDGVAVYEIEFVTDTLEYEYEIDAATGAVLEAKRDRRD